MAAHAHDPVLGCDSFNCQLDGLETWEKVLKGGLLRWSWHMGMSVRDHPDGLSYGGKTFPVWNASSPGTKILHSSEWESNLSISLDSFINFVLRIGCFKFLVPCNDWL